MHRPNNMAAVIRSSNKSRVGTEYSRARNFFSAWRFSASLFARALSRALERAGRRACYDRFYFHARRLRVEKKARADWPGQTEARVYLNERGARGWHRSKTSTRPNLFDALLFGVVTVSPRLAVTRASLFSAAQRRKRRPSISGTLCSPKEFG